MSKKQRVVYSLLALGIGAFSYGLIYWQKPLSERLFQDYSARLNRVLSISIKAPNQTESLPQVYWRSYLKKEPELSLSLLDSITLKHCGLDQLVFEKNSSLGKHASADYTLVWHIDLITGLQTCLANNHLEPQLKASLQHILVTKRAAINVYWHNFLVNELSIRHLWSSQQAIGKNPLPSYRALATNLTELSHIHGELVTSHSINKKQLLQLSEKLQKGASILALLQELNATSAWLNKVTMALDARQFSCQESKADYDILRNILTKVYTVKVQDYLAELDQSANAVLNSLSPLMQQSHAELLVRVNSIHLEFKQANRKHVKQWMQILDSCT
ncbi:DUF3080 family protein [Agarivorans litoreus]|uniref:DUF3080 family protein n=1 Tax=Agarivorans litoreus TaxID=1510455 RepID=UPI001C7D6250|nr:DUF3080 family protein [Agarivorans litoreus]